MEPVLPAGLYRNVLLGVYEVLFVPIRCGWVSTSWLAQRYCVLVLISTNLVLQYCVLSSTTVVLQNCVLSSTALVLQYWYGAS